MNPPRAAPATLVDQAMQAIHAGQWNRGESLATQALGMDPRDGKAFHLRAIARHSLGRFGDAIADYAQAIELGAPDPAILVGLALANLHADRLEDALRAVREALRKTPDSASALRIAAHCEVQVGDARTAVEEYRRLESLAPPGDKWRFIGALAWPPIIESIDQIERRRSEVESALDELIARPAALADPAREIGITAFYMAYQAFDDTRIQKKIAQAYRLASPGLEWRAPHVARPRVPGRKIRLGILSRYLSNHTIGKLNIGIAQKLDRRRFEVVVIRPTVERDFLSEAFDACAEGTVTLPLDLAAARSKIAQAELDALFYTDIGMDAFTCYLPFARLARVQFTTLGHPVTTGIPNMDYFVSSRHCEPADGQRFYSERLVELESLPAYFYRPRPASGFDFRAHLGLGPAERIYACTQTLFKMHPDFDRALVEILRQDPRGRVVLIAAKREAWNERLRTRLALAGPDVASRIVFISALSLPDYLGALRSADALLDTFHFGGGCSSYEAFANSAPIVTLPGERMRARLTTGLYAHMNVSRWVAESADDFVRLALELANGGERRAEWMREIDEGAARFIENDAVVREYEEFIEGAVARSFAKE